MDLLNSATCLGPVADNGGPNQSRALMTGNNTIDGGDRVFGCVDYNSLPIATDQRGLARTLGAEYDNGARERLPPAAFLALVRR